VRSPDITGKLPLSFGPAVSESQQREIVRSMALQFFKWDAQVGDTATLFPQPLLVRPETWRHLSQMAESLAVELTSAETELLYSPQLYHLLGLSKPLQRLFRRVQSLPAAESSVRTLRFDFHYTTEGWRVSEVNSDVPGGYAEASRFTQLMQRYFPSAKVAGDPAKQWLQAMSSALGGNGHVALLSAAGFLEDQQVTAFLASQLQARGVETSLIHHGSQLMWTDGRAFTRSKGRQVEVSSVVRFYQGEWLVNLAGREWMQLMLPQTTLVTNPGTALLTESKRFPLTWPYLRSKMSAWEFLLPECRNPRDDCWTNDESWVVKAAFSNTGDEVHTRDSLHTRAWKRLCSSVRARPTSWVVQRRFNVVAIPSDAGPLYPCLGVYTINGRAAGVYARASHRCVIDYAAMDVALLVDEEQDA
jgi:glutathionylspermidine synthase